MTEPITLDIPHKLGREGARGRLAGGVGKLAEMVPGGGTVEHRWEGDTLHFTVRGMGQLVTAQVEVFDTHVHARVALPPMLALFAGRVAETLKAGATKLLR